MRLGLSSPHVRELQDREEFGLSKGRSEDSTPVIRIRLDYRAIVKGKSHN